MDPCQHGPNCNSVLWRSFFDHAVGGIVAVPLVNQFLNTISWPRHCEWFAKHQAQSLQFYTLSLILGNLFYFPRRSAQHFLTTYGRRGSKGQVYPFDAGGTSCEVTDAGLSARLKICKYFCLLIPCRRAGTHPRARPGQWEATFLAHLATSTANESTSAQSVKPRMLRVISPDVRQAWPVFSALHHRDAINCSL